jgi:hypothetical protein
VPVPVTFSMLQKSPSWICSVIAGVAKTGSRDKSNISNKATAIPFVVLLLYYVHIKIF